MQTTTFAYAQQHHVSAIFSPSSVQQPPPLVDTSPYIRRTLELTPANAAPTFLVPYRQERVSPVSSGFWQERVVSSGFLESFATSALFFAYAAIIIVLFAYDVLPPSWYQPLMQLDVFDSPFSLFIILVIAVLASVFLVTYEYYNGSIRRYIHILDKLRQSAIVLSRYICDRRRLADKQPFIYYRQTSRTSATVADSQNSNEITVLDLLVDCGLILKSIMYEIKYRFRREGRELDLERLPLAPHLLAELIVSTDAVSRTKGLDQYFDALVAMYQRRISALLYNTEQHQQQQHASHGGAVSINGVAMGASPFYALQDLISMIEKSYGDIFVYRKVWASVERFVDVVRIAYWVWLLYLPFKYVNVFGVWALLWYVIPDLIVNSMFVIIGTRLNPFNEKRDSFVVFYDLAEWANENAESVDAGIGVATLENSIKQQQQQQRR
jgi:hypothetical protein